MHLFMNYDDNVFVVLLNFYFKELRISKMIDYDYLFLDQLNLKKLIFLFLNFIYFIIFMNVIHF